jgi:hypothetical protein
VLVFIFFKVTWWRNGSATTKEDMKIFKSTLNEDKASTGLKV